MSDNSGNAETDLAQDTISRLRRRLERERLARQQAEALLEEKSRALYTLNNELTALAGDLERRVTERTAELEAERERAVLIASHDQLTSLANRGRFTTFLEDVCRNALRDGQVVALFLIDIDNFKTINDTLGHEAGDAVLWHVAERLRLASAGQGLAARLGGDEFAVAISGEGDVSERAEALAAVLRQPVPLRNKVIDISCSIGAACLPENAGSSTDLQRFADMALYMSKKKGRARATIFDDELRRRVEGRHALERELHVALALGEIVPWFQPIVDAHTGEMTGGEVLARWQHPGRGILPPSEFLPAVEELGLMNRMFALLMKSACALSAPLVRGGYLRYISLNASPGQFLDGSMATLVADVLENTRFPASSLVIEITEEVLMGDARRFGRELRRLSAMGVKIALDDFGTGYSNIALLRHLPINWLKLDRSLCRELPGSATDRAIVQAVLQMCQALNLEIVAEGIENADQAEWLGMQGCHRLQGYYFGKPEEGENFVKRCVKFATAP